MSGLRHPGVLERLDIRIPRLALDGERGGQILTASFFKGVSLPIQPFPIFPTGVCPVRSLVSSLFSFQVLKEKNKEQTDQRGSKRRCKFICGTRNTSLAQSGDVFRMCPDKRAKA